VSDNEEHAFGMVMPFVVVKSNGGELDDQSFACGWDCGQLYGELETCQRLGATPQARQVKAEILPQLDLIAMHHGFTVTVDNEDQNPDWRRVEFAPVDPHAQGVPE
jgi:hypothetical protein